MEEYKEIIDSILKILDANKRQEYPLLDYTAIIPDKSITNIEFKEIVRWIEKQGWIEITDEANRGFKVKFKLEGMQLMKRHGSYSSFLGSGKSRYPKLQMILNNPRIKAIGWISGILSTIVATLSMC